MVADVHGCGDKIPRHGAGRHAGHHEGRFAQQARELGVDIGLALLGPDQLGAVLADPVDGILDGVFLVAVEELGLVADLVVGAFDGAAEDDADAVAVLVAVRQHADARDAAGTKVDDVGGALEDGGALPLHGQGGDHAHERGDDRVVAGGGISAEVVAGVGVEDGDGQVRLGEAGLDVAQVGVDQGGGGGEIGRVEGGRDGQEAVDEALLALRVGHAVLVEAGGRLELA